MLQPLSLSRRLRLLPLSGSITRPYTKLQGGATAPENGGATMRFPGIDMENNLTRIWMCYPRLILIGGGFFFCPDQPAKAGLWSEEKASMALHEVIGGLFHDRRRWEGAKVCRRYASWCHLSLSLCFTSVLGSSSKSPITHISPKALTSWHRPGRTPTSNASTCPPHAAVCVSGGQCHFCHPPVHKGFAHSRNVDMAIICSVATACSELSDEMLAS